MLDLSGTGRLVILNNRLARRMNDATIEEQKMKSVFILCLNRLATQQLACILIRFLVN